MENLTFFKGLESSFFFTFPSLNSSALSKGERGMGRLSHILFLLVLSLDKVNLTL